MTCAFCGVLNSALDHRCTRCGRKLYASDEHPVATKGSAVLAVDYDRRIQPANSAPPPVSEPVQQPLFHGREPVRETLRLVQMPARGAAKAHSYRRPSGRQEQPRLDFPQPPAPKAADERAVFCNAPVAAPMHRFVAASLDASMIAIGLGLLVIVLHLAGLPITLEKAALPFAATAIVVASLVYRMLWCLAGTDSIGMRWVGLGLKNFDGRTPTRGERVRRLVTSLISWAAAGLGLAWALVDEERLTWHDHMSKTFPSPRIRNQQGGRATAARPW